MVKRSQTAWVLVSVSDLTGGMKLGEGSLIFSSFSFLFYKAVMIDLPPRVFAQVKDYSTELGLWWGLV